MPNPRTCASALLLILAAATARADLPLPDHVVVVIEENHSYGDIIGNPDAPYINSLASSGALFTNSFAIEHPSQPNYLELFSGSNQGVMDDEMPGSIFTTPNLAAELIAQGFTFGGYSQTLPYVGFADDSYSTVPGESQYQRKHNPWVNWQSASPTGNQLSAAVNMPFDGFFPTIDFNSLPTVSFVVPNEQFDMHDGSVADADLWLQSNLGSFAQWALTHNSLLIVTWDEDDFGGSNQIPTIFTGQMIKAGQYGDPINHYDVLRTLEDMYGLSHAGNSASATPITTVFVPEPSTMVLLLACLCGLSLRSMASRKRSR